MSINEFRLEPAFAFSTDESNVLISQGESEICIDGNSYKGDCDVCLKLLPSSKIYFDSHFLGIPADDLMKVVTEKTGISSFSFNGRQIDGFVTYKAFENAQDLHVKWQPKHEPIVGIGNEKTHMARVVFHLFNFIDIWGTRYSSEESAKKMHGISHLDLLYREWTIELKSMVFTRENIQKLKDEGGYQLTHIGVIKKFDDADFLAEEAETYLEAISFFLSFAKGACSDPVCAVGFDSSGKRVWESWSSPRETWNTPLSWFDPHHGSQLTSLFPLFMNRWSDENWRKALEEIIYWYLNANFSSRGIDAGIILTQAAIERLSYEYVVKERQNLSAKKFKKLPSSEKFRLLFSFLGIPIDISASTPEMKRLADPAVFNWLDSPHALTETRNSLVHPEHKRRGQLDSVYFEAWNLGLWYLEMGILAICGYSGTYSNRIKRGWVGDVDNVPWI